MKQLAQKLKNGRLQVLEVPPPVLQPGMVLVENHYSLISTGTEAGTVRAARKSLIGKAKERPRELKQVIEALKQQGPLQTYRAVMKKLDSYSPLGYSSAGIVIDVAPDVSEFSPGNAVACGGGGYANHAEIVAVPKNLCIKLHSGADLSKAAYTTIGAIALQGTRQGELQIGETCAVIGLGLIGQLTCLTLRAGGIKVVGIDIDPEMVEIAARKCADLALTRDDPALKERVMEFSDGIGVDAVIITASTTSTDPLDLAAEISRRKGRVVIVGQVGTGFERGPFYMKELEIRMSCSYGPGRYDPRYEEKGLDYPPGYVRWTEKRNMKAFHELVHSGRVDISYLTTHVFELERAPEAYDLILKKKEPHLGILIKYSAAAKDKNDITENKSVTAEDKNISIDNKNVIAEKKNVSIDNKSIITDNPNVITENESITSGGRNVSADKKNVTIDNKSVIASEAKQSLDYARKINIGFIGAGSYARSFLLPNIVRDKDVSLKAVMTATGTSSKTVAEKYGFEFCTSDADDIFKNADINTVFIATKHNTHAEYVLRSLKADKNTFVEKPLCLTHEELEEIAEFIRQKSEKDESLRLMVGFNRRFSPLAQLIKERVGEGPMAMLYRINAGSIEADSWLHDIEVGGGRVIGEVCHFIDFLTFLNGSLPATVSAVTMPDPHNHHDTLSINLTFENGSIGTISYFSNGSKSVPKEYIEVYRAGVTAILRDFKALEVYGRGRPFRKRLLSQDKGQKKMVHAFLDAIKNSKPSPIPFSEIYATTLATFKIQKGSGLTFKHLWKSSGDC
ncbi:MAG: Gfo/Idh/MocA family oxidoreductase [Candidatus Aminicenantales bacterium]